MEKENYSRIRNLVVAGFSLFSFILVLNIWLDRLVRTEPELPSYVRSTLAISTPPGFEMTLTARPTSEHGQGQGPGGSGGQGEGEHNVELTPSPTFDIDAWVTEDISDDLRDE